MLPLVHFGVCVSRGGVWRTGGVAKFRPLDRDRLDAVAAAKENAGLVALEERRVDLEEPLRPVGEVAEGEKVSESQAREVVEGGQAD